MNEEAKVVMEDIGLEDVIHVCEDIEQKDKVLGALFGGFVVVGAALTVAVVKQKDKIETKMNARRVKKLEKAGYTVMCPETDDSTECDADREVESK